VIKIEKRNPFKGNASQKTQERAKMVGGYLPAELADRLRLLSVYHGRSFQSILQQITTEWSEEIGKTDDEIIEELAEKAMAEWNRRTSEGEANEKQRDAYLREVRNILRRKKVSEHHIERLINKMKVVA